MPQEPPHHQLRIDGGIQASSCRPSTRVATAAATSRRYCTRARPGSTPPSCSASTPTSNLTPQFFDTVGGAFFARPSARFFVTPMQYAAGPPHGWRAIRADLQLLRPGPPLNASRMFARCNGSAATGGPQSSVETAFYAEWASLGKELTGPNGTVILGHRFECWPGHFRRQRCNDYPDHLGIWHSNVLSAKLRTEWSTIGGLDAKGYVRREVEALATSF